MCSESSPWQRTRARCPGNHLPSPTGVGRLRACGTAGAAARGPPPVRGARQALPKGQTSFAPRRTASPGPGSGTPQGCLPPRLLSKSAGRLAKIRKRSQLGEIVPIRHPAPFSRLSRLDPRSAATRTGTFGRPTTKSPTRRDVLDTEAMRVQRPRRIGVPNLTVGEDLPPLLGSVPIVEPWTRATT